MSTHPIKKSTSENGKAVIGYEGYVYTLERKTDVKLIFRCQNRDCKGRCHTNTNSTMDVIVSAPTEHCYASKPDLVPVLELKNKIKLRVPETEESSSTILHSAMRSFPLDTADQLPESETLLRTSRRQHGVGAGNKKFTNNSHKCAASSSLSSGRKKPLFPIEIWNVYDRTVVNLPRSNNSIKGWHNAFTKRVAIVHSTITKLTEKIRREQSKFEVDIAQIRQGQEPKPKKLKYRKLDERIKRLVDDYGNVDLGAYLKRLANQHVCDELPVQHIFLATNCLQRIALRRIVQLPIEDDDPFSSVQLQFQ
ncbi:unnamed protein product [Rotaria socialis]|uniref:FLYWCH-type domain-containing protein n=1 Tax=Rotaria socialis TaxID=392032 RepID=A0A818P4W0_9BILA|nr:unnamed protein product [Rotaria socialis]